MPGFGSLFRRGSSKKLSDSSDGLQVSDTSREAGKRRHSHHRSHSEVNEVVEQLERVFQDNDQGGKGNVPQANPQQLWSESFIVHRKSDSYGSESRNGDHSPTKQQRMQSAETVIPTITAEELPPSPMSPTDDLDHHMDGQSIVRRRKPISTIASGAGMLYVGPEDVYKHSSMATRHSQSQEDFDSVMEYRIASHRQRVRRGHQSIVPTISLLDSDSFQNVINLLAIVLLGYVFMAFSKTYHVSGKLIEFHTLHSLMQGFTEMLAIWLILVMWSFSAAFLVHISPYLWRPLELALFACTLAVPILVPWLVVRDILEHWSVLMRLSLCLQIMVLVCKMISYFSIGTEYRRYIYKEINRLQGKQNGDDGRTSASRSQSRGDSDDTTVSASEIDAPSSIGDRRTDKSALDGRKTHPGRERERKPMSRTNTHPNAYAALYPSIDAPLSPRPDIDRRSVSPLPGGEQNGFSRDICASPTPESPRDRRLSVEEMVAHFNKNGKKYFNAYRYFLFLCYPTLTFERRFPRVRTRNIPFLFRELFVFLYLCLCIYVLIYNHLQPALRASLMLNFMDAILQLMLPSLILWLLLFYAVQQNVMNILAEVTLFGDREFYLDWWNSRTLSDFWRSWNRPLYKFMCRHVFIGFQRYLGQTTSSLMTFLVTALMHEYILTISSNFIFRPIISIIILLQIPVMYLTRRPYFQRTRWGNIVMWVSLMCGLPIIATMYAREFYFVELTRMVDMP